MGARARGVHRPLLALAFTLFYFGGSSSFAERANCFVSTDQPAVHVIQQAPPPASDGTVGYKFFPASAFASAQIDKIAATKTTRLVYFWQWSNHGPRRVPKSNLGPMVLPGGPTKVFFSTIDRADACTMTQVASVFGDERAAKGFSEGIVERQTSKREGSFTDVCFVHSQTLSPNAAGVVLDYEAADGRTPDQAKSFLLKFARYVHDKGKKVILYTNPLNAPTQSLTGVRRDNIDELVDAFDLTDILIWGRNPEQNAERSFQNQKDLMRVWRPEKMYVVFDLNYTSIEDAAAIGRVMQKNEIGTISFWRDFAEQGGACDTVVNRKISCLALNKCTN